MEDAIFDIAQAAAGELEAEYGQGVGAEVALALHDADSRVRPDQYFDPVSLGGLIVSAATLAWTIYNDRKGNRLDVDARELAKKVQGGVGEVGSMSGAERDRLIEVVVRETIVVGEGS